MYSSRAPNTKMMQAMTQHSIAVKPSALGNVFTKSVLYSWAGPELTLGLFVCMVLWMLMSTRKIVTSRVIRPGIISGFTRKLEEDNVI